MQRIAGLHQKLGEEARKDSPQEHSERTWPFTHLGFRLQASRNVREYISVV